MIELRRFLGISSDRFDGTHACTHARDKERSWMINKRLIVAVLLVRASCERERKGEITAEYIRISSHDSRITLSGKCSTE